MVYAQRHNDSGKQVREVDDNVPDVHACGMLMGGRHSWIRGVGQLADSLPKLAHYHRHPSSLPELTAEPGAHMVAAV